MNNARYIRVCKTALEALEYQLALLKDLNERRGRYYVNRKCLSNEPDEMMKFEEEQAEVLKTIEKDVERIKKIKDTIEGINEFESINEVSGI